VYEDRKTRGRKEDRKEGRERGRKGERKEGRKGREGVDRVTKFAV
jgi:hypothetical protein